MSKYLNSLLTMAHINHLSHMRCYLLGDNLNKNKAGYVCPEIECDKCVFTYLETAKAEVIKILEDST